MRKVFAVIFAVFLSVNIAAPSTAYAQARSLHLTSTPSLSAPALSLANAPSLNFNPLSPSPLNVSSLNHTLVPAAVLPSITPVVAVKPVESVVAVNPAIPLAAAPAVARSLKAATVEPSSLSALYDGSRSLSSAASVEGRDPSLVPSALRPAAPPSREDFPRLIDHLISPRRAELQALVHEYSSASSPESKKSVDARIQSLVDDLNVLRVPAGLSHADIEVAAPDFFTDDFKSSPDYPRYRALAESRLLNGDYIPQFVYAGAATRLLQDFEEVLGRKLDPLPYRMYGLDLWSVLRQMHSLDDAALLKLFQSQKIKEPEAMIARLKAYEIPKGARALGMGPRQVLAYRSLLANLARQNGENPVVVLKRQRPVFHLNEEIADSVLKDFEKNDFYGFDRDKVVFIIQPIFKGYRLGESGAALASDSPALPYGHGYATTQLKYPDAFTLGADGSYRPLPRSFLDEMLAADTNSRFVLATHRINDTTKFSPAQVVDLDKLALSLSLLDRGFGVTIDLVGNPGKQKGGNNIRYKGEERSFLIETSNAKGSAGLTSLLDAAAQTNAPYNAFRLTSTPAVYKGLLDRGIRYNLRFKNGFFYLESVTGDLTQIPDSRSVAVQTKGELIHDFKQLANLLDALEFAREQDSSSGRRGH